ncbi:MAG: hypothetical protein HKM03_06205 [Steroidobacteraceae bacterium]|nr:hypothetical protein [Steroidobacteraceae bacterium]
MFTKMSRLILVACVICPSLSWALGLGEIHLHSALGEPLKADIDLIAATPNDLSGLHAALAPIGEFTRYGIDHPPFLATFQFHVAKGKDGQAVLRVTSTSSIPEPFVTFLVEVDWARGHLMREYTVLLDPPIYASGKAAEPPAPVAVAVPNAAPLQSAPTPSSAPAPAATPVVTPAAATPTPAVSERPHTYRVSAGDTLSRIARHLGAAGPGAIDQTMIALFRANPGAFDGNVNLLHRGAILRVPGAAQIAALNERDAIAAIDRQMSAWQPGARGSRGQLRLVAPGAATGAAGAGGTAAGAAANTSLRDRVQQLETQLATERRLVDIRNQELAALQAKLGVKPAPASSAAPAAVPPTPTASAASVASAAPAVAAAVPAPTKKTATVVPPPAKAHRSWVEWATSNWWLPGGVVVALLGALGFAAFKRRQREQLDEFAAVASPGLDTDVREGGPRVFGSRKAPAEESFVVEESGEHKAPEFAPTGDTAEIPASDDTMSSESAVNLDQGDPLAEADFHMAYGLYDQAADLVRIALDREPERRDLRLKLLEIYFVWGNKDLFLQTAKSLYTTRDRAAAGEWDKIVIMGKQICPADPLFANAEGGGRGAGALVDLNLEGGENHVDVDLFGEPAGELSPHEPAPARDAEDAVATGESPQLHGDSGLDFVLDTPERGVDESPTREMPPRDEPTVESEMMPFVDSGENPTAESPALTGGSLEQRLSAKLGQGANTEQTAEVSIDDLGLDLDSLDETGTPALSGSHLEPATPPSDSDAPTMIAGVDERSRRMIAEAESRARDRDLTELERELEASFISELESSHSATKTSVLAPAEAPTLQLPRGDEDAGATARVKAIEIGEPVEGGHHDPDSTSTLRAVNSDSVDLDLDRLAGALGGGDTVDQPRAPEDLFSSEVFEASQRSRRVDLDVGDMLGGADAAPTKSLVEPTEALPQVAGDVSAEFEPVTMSEVGTKLDLARAYMDMGDPEGARSILDEVMQEGSASQKQEAERLLHSLPG